MKGGDLELVVQADGTVQMIHDDDLADAFLGDGQPTETRRASHVEPAATWCAAHHRVRDERCVQCEQHWPGGGWIADMHPVGGPILGPFGARSYALSAETRWLKAAMARRKV